MDLKTVGDLVDFLSTQPRDRLVVLSSDAEGNSYSPLADANESMYAADSTWSGEAYKTNEQIDALIATGDDDWSDDDRAPEDAVRVVVLGPTN